MKNKRFELHKMKMKQYAKSHPWELNKDGLRVFHLYGGEYKKDLSWWDDVGFMRNKYKVVVWWVHPRMTYKDKVDSLADDAIPYPSHGSLKEEWFDKKNANYVKVGKSRKKVLTYTLPESKPSIKEWYKQFDEFTKRTALEGDVVVKPSFKVETLSWCRGVSICIPVEVHSEEDLKMVCSLVKRILNGETTVDQEFPGYVYTKENWKAEIEIIGKKNNVT